MLNGGLPNSKTTLSKCFGHKPFDQLRPCTFVRPSAYKRGGIHPNKGTLFAGLWTQNEEGHLLSGRNI